MLHSNGKISLTEKLDPANLCSEVSLPPLHNFQYTTLKSTTNPGEEQEPCSVGGIHAVWVGFDSTMTSTGWDLEQITLPVCKMGMMVILSSWVIIHSNLLVYDQENDKQ